MRHVVKQRGSSSLVGWIGLVVLKAHIVDATVASNQLWSRNQNEENIRLFNLLALDRKKEVDEAGILESQSKITESTRPFPPFAIRVAFDFLVLLCKGPRALQQTCRGNNYEPIICVRCGRVWQSVGGGLVSCELDDCMWIGEWRSGGGKRGR